VEGEIGYSFLKLTPAIGRYYSEMLQSLGFMSIIIGLLWSNKDKLSSIDNRGYRSKLEN